MLVLGVTLSPGILFLATVLLLAGCCAAWLPHPQRPGGSGESLSAACVCITSAVGMCLITAVTTPRSTYARTKHSSECAPPMAPPQKTARAPAPFARPAASPASKSRAKKRRRSSKNSQATTLSTSVKAQDLLLQPTAGESSLESSDSSDESAATTPAKVSDYHGNDKFDEIEPGAAVHVYTATDMCQAAAEDSVAADTEDTTVSSQVPEDSTSSLFSHPYNVYPCVQAVTRPTSVAAVTPLCACCHEGHPRRVIFSYTTPNVSCTNCTAACGVSPAPVATLQIAPSAPSLPLDSEHFHDTLSSTPQTRTYKEVISPRITSVPRAGVVGAQANAFAQQHKSGRPAAVQTIGVVPSGFGAVGVLGHSYSLFGVGELQRLLTV